ncbi:hypothetical protein [Fusibacter tunisiensis]|uniref:YtxH domain-containing protein n=1 Tax=Fusibacter tunisiensis TaxID=1008308 RepID=A0ABS2MU95_9FIRM|nr:hypothetical protein [Fusibacter tunisiensis]MBM7563001.1 hypothetical protein [Fusibacter tunisiensis]
MLLRKYSQLKIENEELKRMQNKYKRDIFFVGALLGALLALIGVSSYKTKPIEKLKYSVYNLKGKISKRLNTTIENAEDKVEEFIDEIEKSEN